MPGQYITDEQRRKFMKHITEEKTLSRNCRGQIGFQPKNGFPNQEGIPQSDLDRGEKAPRKASPGSS